MTGAAPSGVDDVRPDESLEHCRAQAAAWQDDARNRYGRRLDTYRVCELVDVPEAPEMDVTVTVHAIADDGLPDFTTDRTLVGRVAFLFDGCIVSGWPLPGGLWEANTDVGHGRPFGGVTHWVEFPRPLREFAAPPTT